MSLSNYPSVTETVSFNVRIGYSCSDSTLSIPATTPFIDRTYEISQALQSQSWGLDSNLVEIDSQLDCGAYQIAFSQSKDGGPLEPLDSNVFTVDSAAKLFSVETSDDSKAGVYTISYEAWLDSYLGVTAVTNTLAYF